MGMLIFMFMMMFTSIRDGIQSSIPIGFPIGVEKLKLGYFKKLPVSGIYGDMIKLNDGRVLIYRVTGNRTYIFDPKNDSFERTAITNAPSFWKEKGYKAHYINHTESGVTLNNGKVLILNPPIKEEISEIEYYNRAVQNLDERDFIRHYHQERTEDSAEKAKTYIRENNPSLYKRYLTYKAYEEDAKHAHLYNPETGKMEQIDIPPFDISVETYKILLNNGNVLIINNPNIAIFNATINKFSVLPDNHKLIGYHDYAILNDGNIFMIKNGYPYVYDFQTDTLSRKCSEIGTLLFSSYVQLQDDRFLYLSPENIYDNGDYENINLIMYDVNKDKISKTPIILNFSGRRQFMQRISDDKALITGKDYDIYDRKSATYNRPDYHVEIYDAATGSSKILTKKVKYKHSFESSRTLLLDDGRVLMQNAGRYEMFIPYTYKAEKKAERKQLKQEAKKK